MEGIVIAGEEILLAGEIQFTGIVAIAEPRTAACKEQKPVVRDILIRVGGK